MAEKDGFTPCKLETSRTMNLWVLGNILIGGLIGLGIDLITGAVVSIEQEEIKMILYGDKPCEILIKAKYGQSDAPWVKYTPAKDESGQK